jgi:hypothetical protein
MDYKRWVEDAVAFTRNLSRLQGTLEVTCEVAPPLSSEELAAIAAQFPAGVPRELARFWTEGSAHLTCTYWWKPAVEELVQFQKIFPKSDFLWGGANFREANDFSPPETNVGAVQSPQLMDFDKRVQSILDNFFGGFGVESEADASSDADAVNWAPLPWMFHLLGSGNYLALHPEMSGADPHDPPVVLFDHELGGIGLVADRFTAFLQAWQEWSYIGMDRLRWWSSTNPSGMEADKGKALALRALLQHA